MKPLLLLLALPFAADSAALGDAHFATRHAATQRLRKADWRAIPTLLLAAADATSPERADRAADLLAAVRPLPCRVAAALVAADADALPDDRLPPLRAALCVEFDRLGEIRVCDVGSSYTVRLSGSVAIYEWSRREAHYGGSEAAELRLLVEAARARRRELTAAAAGGAAAVAVK